MDKVYNFYFSCRGNSVFDIIIQFRETHLFAIKITKEILDYKYSSNTLIPDFLESFSLFGDYKIAEQNKDIQQALQKSFNLDYKVLKKIWTLSPKSDKQQDKCLVASSNRYKGVELYIVTENTTSLYGFVAYNR